MGDGWTSCRSWDNEKNGWIRGKESSPLLRCNLASSLGYKDKTDFSSFKLPCFLGFSIWLWSFLRFSFPCGISTVPQVFSRDGSRIRCEYLDKLGKKKFLNLLHWYQFSYNPFNLTNLIINILYLCQFWPEITNMTVGSLLWYSWCPR